MIDYLLEKSKKNKKGKDCGPGFANNVGSGETDKETECAFS